MPRSRPDGFTDDELEAWGGLLRFHASITRELSEALQDTLHLSVAEYEVLLKLATSPGGVLPQAALGPRSHLTLTQSGLSRLVTRLRERGLLIREPGPDGDRRSATLRITPQGRALWRKASKAHAQRVRARFLDQLDDRELKMLGDVFARLRPDSTDDRGGPGRT